MPPKPICGRMPELWRPDVEAGLFGQMRRDQPRTALDGRTTRQNAAPFTEYRRAPRVQFISRGFQRTREKLLVRSSREFRRLLLLCDRPNRFRGDLDLLRLPAHGKSAHYPKGKERDRQCCAQSVQAPESNPAPPKQQLLAETKSVRLFPSNGFNYR